MKSLISGIFAVFLGIIMMSTYSPVFAANATPAATTGLTDAQKAQVNAMIKDYIAQNGQQIVSSVQSWQMEQQKQMSDAAAATLKKDHDKLVVMSDPVAGNPKGDVTLIQFYDYNCHYCKGVAPTLSTLLDQDKNLRIVYKQFPILGPTSTMAAQAALAANKQGKFLEFHNALMKNNQPLTEDRVVEIAKSVKGLDVSQLKDDANSVDTAAEIKQSLALGEEIGVRGTPAFVIADQLVPGAEDIETFKQKIADARQKEHQ